MIMVTDKNREYILDTYTEYLLDSMDFNSIWRLAYEHIRSSKELMDNEPLEQEILDYCPEILED